MKNLVGKVISKKFKFMETDVVINKLSVGKVMEIQEKVKILADQENSSLEMLQFVIASAVAGADELTPEDFSSFPIDELSKLSNAVLEFSGLGNAVEKK